MCKSEKCKKERTETKHKLLPESICNVMQSGLIQFLLIFILNVIVNITII